jgi:hypothetical protein
MLKILLAAPNPGADVFASLPEAFSEVRGFAKQIRGRSEKPKQWEDSGAQASTTIEPVDTVTAQGGWTM